MVSISDALSKIVAQTPFLEEGLASGIINLSALARSLRPGIEKRLLKDVSDAALVMALKRLAERIRGKQPRPKEMAKYVSDITVRSHLSEFTFRNSETMLPRQIKLLQEIRGRGDRFVTFSSGADEVTAIVSSDLSGAMQRIFAGERLLARYDGLSAIILRLSPQTVAAPGIYYLVLKLLAWDNINVTEVVSTYTEFVILLDDANIDRAFSSLRSLLLPRR
ncbi:MAG: aspartate kinase [Acidobacteria bacterium]|jgi:hypothetical protein|nr:aspartate kinase [Acidobacteriota bacterium]